VDVDLIGWVVVGLGGTYGCRCGILYAPILGVVFYAGVVSLISSYSSPCSPYSSELIGGFLSRKHDKMKTSPMAKTASTRRIHWRRFLWWLSGRSMKHFILC